MKQWHETLSKPSAFYVVDIKAHDQVQIPANSDEMIYFRQTTVFQMFTKLTR